MSESNTAISERSRISQTRFKKTGLNKIKVNQDQSCPQHGITQH